MDYVSQQTASPAAHDLLTRVVSQMISEGRSTKAAGLKPRLAIASGGTFRERALGFETFRAFLEDAAREGVVTLREVAGPDLEVGLPGADPAATSQGRWIRHDVYVAFAEWGEGYQAVWDRAERRAYRYEMVGGNDEVAILRSRMAVNPHSFVAIQPLEAEEVWRWMREFSNEQSNLDVRTLLQSALSRERPLQAFVRVAGAFDVQNAWTTYRLGRLRRRIEDWAEANTVDLGPTVFAAEPPPAAFNRTVRPTPAHAVGPKTPPSAAELKTPASTDLLRLREFVKTAVNRMTLSELAALPIAAYHHLED